MPDFWARTLAIISLNYLNYNSRLGYHFATLNAFISEVRNDNYISFRFQGGAADQARRGRRAQFLGTVMARLDFEVEVTGDLVVAKLWKYPRPLMEEKLDLVGRLMGCARQRDMVIAAMRRLTDVDAFLAGTHRFSRRTRRPPRHLTHRWVRFGRGSLKGVCLTGRLGLS